MSNLIEAAAHLATFHEAFRCQGCGRKFVKRWQGQSGKCILCEHLDAEYEAYKRKQIQGLRSDLRDLERDW